MSAKKKDMALCMIFLVLLVGGFLFCVFLPKENYSESERRMLSPMPKWSAQGIWSGRFMSEFES